MEVKLIDNEKDFYALKEDWQRLSRNYYLIHDFEWLYCWWEHFKNNNELKIVVVKEEGKTVGIAPLYVQKCRALGFIPYKKLCFIGGEVSDHLNFMIEPESNFKKVFKILLDFMLNHISYDSSDLRQIRNDNINFFLWNRYLAKTKIDFNCYLKCHRADLSHFSSFDEYIKTKGGSYKKQQNKFNNRLKKNNINVRHIFTKEISEQDINEIAEINLKRQNQLIKKGSNDRWCHFWDKKKIAFMKKYFCTEEEGIKGFFITKYDDKIVAYHLVFMKDQVISLWNGGFDPDYSYYAPAKPLFAYVMKYAFDNNIRYVDFGRGDDPYKQDWTNLTSYCYRFEYCKSKKAKFIHSYREAKKNIFNGLNKLRFEEIAFTK